MIEFIKGNILESNAEALINTVNTMGVMGKGIALQFKKNFPNNYKAYLQACKNHEMKIGRLFVNRESSTATGEKIIINFPTKTSWRKPSEYEYIEAGLSDLINVIDSYKISSIAIPPLGAGNGGLEWEKVKKMLVNRLNHLKITIQIYEPSEQIKEQLKKERVKLTDARALLLYVLYDLVSQGEYVSEFSSEKVCYFLQRFGAEKYFNLKYEPNFYGPYSGKVRFILNALSGSYIMGYRDMNKKPFEPLTLVADGLNDVTDYIQNKPELKKIASVTINFLNGFYADFALELLSSVDHLMIKHQTEDKEAIWNHLQTWSDRKRTMFSDEKYINISLAHLKQASFV